MLKIKWFTQRITGLIVYPLVLVVIPFVIAKVGQGVSLWNFIDSLYQYSVIYWITLIMTRVAYAFIWLKIAEWFVEWGKRFEFFWFRPEKEWSTREEESVDKSGQIMGVVVFIVFAAFVAEVAIRFLTLTFPPYLTPAN